MENQDKKAILGGKLAVASESIHKAAKKEVEKITLLLEAPKQHNDVAQALGWTEDINQAQEELGIHVKELDVRAKYPELDIILREDDLILKCLETSYTVCRLGEYKHQTTTELKALIKDYCEKNNVSLGSLNSGSSDVFIMYPLYLDQNFKASDIVKNRQAKLSDELILIERLVLNGSDKNYYTIIGSTGIPAYNKSNVMNFINTINIFKSHSKINELYESHYDCRHSSIKFRNLLAFAVFILLTLISHLATVPTNINFYLFIIGMSLAIIVQGMILPNLNAKSEDSLINSDEQLRKPFDNNYNLRRIIKFFSKNNYHYENNKEFIKKIKGVVYKKYWINASLNLLVTAIIFTILSVGIFAVKSNRIVDKDYSSETDLVTYYKSTTYIKAPNSIYYKPINTVIISENKK